MLGSFFFIKLNAYGEPKITYKSILAKDSIKHTSQVLDSKVTFPNLHVQQQADTCTEKGDKNTVQNLLCIVHQVKAYYFIHSNK